MEQGPVILSPSADTDLNAVPPSPNGFDVHGRLAIHGSYHNPAAAFNRRVMPSLRRSFEALLPTRVRELEARLRNRSSDTDPQYAPFLQLLTVNPAWLRRVILHSGKTRRAARNDRNRTDRLLLPN